MRNHRSCERSSEKLDIGREYGNQMDENGGVSHYGVHSWITMRGLKIIDTKGGRNGSSGGSQIF